MRVPGHVWGIVHSVCCLSRQVYAMNIAMTFEIMVNRCAVAVMVMFL